MTQKNSASWTTGKTALCLMALLVPLLIYPKLLFVSPEIAGIHGWQAESDLFNYWKSILVIIFGLIAFFSIKEIPIWAKSVLFFLVCSLLRSPAPSISLFGLPNYCEGTLSVAAYVFIILYSAKVGTSAALQKCLKLSVVLMFVVAMSQIAYGNYFHAPWIKFFMSSFDINAESWPLYATLGNPNHLGLFCALLFPYFLARGEYFIWPLLGVMAIGSENRGAWVSILISSVYLLRKRAVYLIPVLLIICIPFRAHLKTRIELSSESGIHWPIRNTDLSSRVYIWKKTMPMLKRTLIFGSGMGTYLLYFPQEDKEKLAAKLGADDLVDRPHNIYLQIFHALGLPVLIIIGFFILDTWRLSEIDTKGAILGFCIAGLFTDSMIGVTPIFCILLGMARHQLNRRY